MSARRRGIDRRRFVKQAVIGGGGVLLGAYTVDELLRNRAGGELRVGFRNDAPAQLWEWSREAQWYEAAGHGLVRCVLCPHDCILGENDRGFCRVRVVKEGRLHSIVYGNPCAVHVDPMEKKPLHHFLPGSSILSIATAGCNLRCLNCQNWEISQSRPEETDNQDLRPEVLVQAALQHGLPAIAYTYSEPIVFYEYVRDAAALACEKGLRNVLVTAGYIAEAPLRALCRVTDAANVDLKGFTDGFYKRVTTSTLRPVLRALEVMREEGVWIEVTRLIVPDYSDDLDDIREMCRWLVGALGADTPLHLSRFHPAYKLIGLPPTPAATLESAYAVAREAGLLYVYVGNLPGHPSQNTACPGCGRTVVERVGYFVPSVSIDDGRCACGEPISGVWS
ncbi:MAG: AmmeMemoRadiSam system radical SAM enzyme [Planctomycetota bacterium]